MLAMASIRDINAPSGSARASTVEISSLVDEQPLSEHLIT